MRQLIELKLILERSGERRQVPGVREGNRTPFAARRPLRNAAWLLIALIALGMSAPAAETADAQLPDYGVGVKAFPHIFRPYISRPLPPPDLSNAKSISEMIREGKIELSMAQLMRAVIENNLDIAIARYNYYFAETDILRTKGGAAARGVDAAGASVPNSLFNSAIGGGIGAIATLGGIGVTGSLSGQQRALNLAPRGLYDPVFLFNFSWDRTSSPLSTAVVAGTPFVTPNTTFLQFGWEQAFTSGTSFAAQFSTQRQSSTQQKLIYDPDVVSRLSVNVVQQILNGYGFAVNRRFLAVTENNKKIAREWFRQQVTTTLAQAQSSYWDLAASQEQVRSSEEALRAAEQLRDEDEKREQAGMLAPLDVIGAESQVAAAQRDLIVAQTQLQYQEMAFKNFFSKEVTDALGSARIVPTDPLPEPKEKDIPSLQEALPAAMRNRPEIPQGEGVVKNDAAAVKFTRNYLLPTFNMFGGVASSGLYGNTVIPNPGGLPIVVPGGLGQELTQFAHFKYPEFYYGVSMTIPLRNRSASADAARSQLDERQAEVSLQRTRNQIELQVRTAIIGLMQSKAQVASARQAVRLNQETLDADQKKLAAGLMTSYDVTLGQRDLLAAQLAAVQAEVAYAKAMVARDQATGELLDNYHITVEDALAGRIMPSPAAAPVR